MIGILNFFLEFFGLFACAGILIRRLKNRAEFWKIAKFDTFLIFFTAIFFSFAALIKIFLPNSFCFTIYAGGLISVVTIFECLRLFYFQTFFPQIQKNPEIDENRIFFEDGVAKFIEISLDRQEYEKISLDHQEFAKIHLSVK